MPPPSVSGSDSVHAFPAFGSAHPHLQNPRIPPALVLVWPGNTFARTYRWTPQLRPGLANAAPSMHVSIAERPKYDAMAAGPVSAAKGTARSVNTTMLSKTRVLYVSRGLSRTWKPCENSSMFGIQIYQHSLQLHNLPLIVRHLGVMQSLAMLSKQG